MSTVKVKCPHCGKGYQLNVNQLGKKLRCKSCSNIMFFRADKNKRESIKNKVLLKEKKQTVSQVSSKNNFSNKRKRQTKKSGSKFSSMLMLLLAGAFGAFGYSQFEKNPNLFYDAVENLLTAIKDIKANDDVEVVDQDIPSESSLPKEVFDNITVVHEEEPLPKEVPQAKLLIGEKQDIEVSLEVKTELAEKVNKDESLESEENMSEEQEEPIEEHIVYTPETPIHKTIDKYCYQCHNLHKNKGGLNFDLINFEKMDLYSYKNLVAMLDSITAEEMPPKNKPQPPKGELKEFISWMSSLKSRNRLKMERMKPQTTMRRLNKMEFKNTISDLFGVDADLLRSIDKFPDDQTKGKYTNNGEALKMSSFQLANYPNVAKEIVDTIYETEKYEKPSILEYKPPFRERIIIGNKVSKHWDHISKAEVEVFGKAAWVKNEYQDFSNSAQIEILEFSQNNNIIKHDYTGGAPEKGYYEISFTAMGKNRMPNNKYEVKESFLKNRREKIKTPYWDIDKPLTVQLMIDNEIVEEYKLLDHELKDYKTIIHLEKRQAIFFRFPQGFPLHWSEYYQNPLKAEFGSPLPKNGKKNMHYNEWFNFYAEHYPTLRMTNLKIAGPLVTKQTKQAHYDLLNGQKFERSSPRHVIKEVMKKAFRGYASDKNTNFIASYTGNSKHFENKKHAIQNGIQAVLSSPFFLYLVEETDEKGRLLPLSLANRLAYFIWGSMPDQELIDLAKSGQLSKEQVLKAQIKRMLQSDKRMGLVKRMTKEWIDLRKLGEMPPGRTEFPEYFNYKVEENSLEETNHFVNYLIKENLTILNFIHSKFTFVNRPLAKFYGYPDAEEIPEDEFIKVPILNDRRGGLIGHSSVLTATADDVMTNPIMRGLWVMRTLLGQNVPDPPEISEPVEVDLREAKSFRSQLAIHNSLPNCKSCHEKFDHFGFALQSYDVTGKEREFFFTNIAKRKKIKTPIETHGIMTNGKKFDDIVDMKRILLDNPRDFSKGLIKELLEMACGREMTVLDEPAISSLASRARGYQYKLADIITLVATSSTFKNK